MTPDSVRDIVRAIAALMTVVNATVWTLVSRWERPGRGAQHRVRLHSPSLVRLGDVGLYISLIYPLLIVIAPNWTYDGWANWSSSMDVVLQGAGLVSWIAGMAVLLWASRVMGQQLAIDGLAEDHEFVTRGPYRYVRHPVYAAFTAIAIGTALVFRSYVVLGLSVMVVIAGRWWASAEESVLASPEGFGDAYSTYSARTGRFLPRLRGSGGERSGGS
jgi:protein-S-isoprenylcysteine O-methyltransferase Ste14